MWENSSAYVRVRFDDIAPKNNHNHRRSTNIHNTNKLHNSLISFNTKCDNANKVKPATANYNNIEKLILCLMETSQWLHLEVQPIYQVILLFEQKYL